MVEENERKGLHQAVVALDLSTAFNSAWKPYMRRRLRVPGVGKRLGGICSDFLSGRALKSEMVTRNMEPTLWNVITEGWFRKLERANEHWIDEIERDRGIDKDYISDLVQMQAYADDYFGQRN